MQNKDSYFGDYYVEKNAHDELKKAHQLLKRQHTELNDMLYQTILALEKNDLIHPVRMKNLYVRRLLHEKTALVEENYDLKARLQEQEHYLSQYIHLFNWLLKQAWYAEHHSEIKQHLKDNIISVK